MDQGWACCVDLQMYFYVWMDVHPIVIAGAALSNATKRGRKSTLVFFFSIQVVIHSSHTMPDRVLIAPAI